MEQVHLQQHTLYFYCMDCYTQSVAVYLFICQHYFITFDYYTTVCCYSVNNRYMINPLFHLVIPLKVFFRITSVLEVEFTNFFVCVKICVLVICCQHYFKPIKPIGCTILLYSFAIYCIRSLLLVSNLYLTYFVIDTCSCALYSRIPVSNYYYYYLVCNYLLVYWTLSFLLDCLNVCLFSILTGSKPSIGIANPYRLVENDYHPLCYINCTL